MSARSTSRTPRTSRRSSSGTAASGRETDGPATASPRDRTDFGTRESGSATGNTDTASPHCKTVTHDRAVIHDDSAICSGPSSTRICGGGGAKLARDRKRAQNISRLSKLVQPLSESRKRSGSRVGLQEKSCKRHNKVTEPSLRRPDIAVAKVLPEPRRKQHVRPMARSYANFSVKCRSPNPKGSLL